MRLDRHVPSLQQAHGLLVARRAASIGALGLFVELVLFEHVAIALDARDLPRACASAVLIRYCLPEY